MSILFGTINLYSQELYQSNMHLLTTENTSVVSITLEQTEKITKFLQSIQLGNNKELQGKKKVLEDLKNDLIYYDDTSTTQKLNVKNFLKLIGNLYKYSEEFITDSKQPDKKFTINHLVYLPINRQLLTNLFQHEPYILAYIIKYLTMPDCFIANSFKDSFYEVYDIENTRNAWQALAPQQNDHKNLKTSSNQKSSYVQTTLLLLFIFVAGATCDRVLTMYLFQ